MVAATGWSPTYYADTFDTRDLITLAKVLEDANKRSKR